MRRVTVTNNSEEVREIELTSYGEIVLSHPRPIARIRVRKLFVETEWHEWASAITATRARARPREDSLDMHVVDNCRRPWDRSPARPTGPASWTGPHPRDPMPGGRRSLSETTGAVLDPIARGPGSAGSGQSASVAFTHSSRPDGSGLAGRPLS